VSWANSIDSGLAIHEHVGSLNRREVHDTHVAALELPAQFIRTLPVANHVGAYWKGCAADPGDGDGMEAPAGSDRS
jgi:hypothetical protein